jgi:tetratricopeptide (TPR) repeat protein
VLTGGARDLPSRQRTLRDAIAWSHDLLSPDEQKLFRRLAVFAGGARIESVEAVANAEGDLDVLAGMSGLVDHGLLEQVTEAAGEPRFRMLETIREFGLEQLALAGEEDATRTRHADHFLHLAESLGYGIQINWHFDTLERIAAERDNMRLALAWCDEHERFDALLQLGNALFAIWVSPSQDGLAWIDRVLERSRHVVSAARVQALNGAGIQALFQGDYARAAPYFAEELALARELGDPFHLGEALVNAGFLAYRNGEYGLAENYLIESLGPLCAASRTNPAARLNTGRAFLILGDTALVQERFNAAAARYREALDLAEVTDTVWGFSDIHAGLAGACFCRGEVARAAALYAEALGPARQALTAESVVHVQNRGFTPIILSALLGLAGIAAETGIPRQGAPLFAAAEVIAASQGVSIFPRDRPVRERSLAALHAALETDALAAARMTGEALTIEQAVAEATAVAAAVIATGPALRD